MTRRWSALLVVTAALAGCGGGGGGGAAPVPASTATTAPAAPTPTASATPAAGPSPATASTTIPAGGALAQSLPAVGGYGGSIVAQITQGTGGTVTATLALGGLPSVAGQPTMAPFTGAPSQVLVYADFVVSNVPAVTVASTTLTLTFPAGTILPNTSYYYAIWPGNAQTPNWISSSGGLFPVTTIDPVNQNVTIAGSPGISFAPGYVYGFVVYR